jgi:hypothetical protein
MQSMQLLILILIIPLASLGQLSRGTITGMVKDGTGAVVPGAPVHVAQTATNAVSHTITNEAGQYTVPNLPPGSYEITVEAQGFKRLVRKNIELRVTEVLNVELVLELGTVSEAIEVTAEVSRLQTETPEVGTSLDNAQLLDLPLSFGGARLAENFAYKITPGVFGGTWTSHINGSTSFSKETLVDGASATTMRAGEFGQMSNSVEALQEFKIQTSGMSAEYGRSQGGVYNYVMKSGANEIHGSGYFGLRNEVLNANTFVNNANGVRRALDRKINYAGSFGGPVYLPKIYDGHNKTFFYTAYEHYRDRSLGIGGPSRTAPLPQWYEGDLSALLGPVTTFSDALGRPVARGAIYDPATFRRLDSGRWVGDMFPSNRIPASRFSQVSRRINSIAKQHYLPTVRDASGNIPLVNNAVFPQSNTPEFDQYQFSVKADQIISSSHKVSGSYSFNTRPRLLLDQGGLWDVTDSRGGPLSKARFQTLHSNFVRLAYDWTVSPRVLNHMMASYNRNTNPNASYYAKIDGAKELGIKNLSTHGYPAIDWGNGPFVTLGNLGDTQDSVIIVNVYGLADTVSFSAGKHFIKAGFDMRRSQRNDRPTAGGSFNFAARGTAIPGEAFSGNQTGYAFASYLLGIVDSAGRSDPAVLGGRRRYYAMFLQDDFKVTPRLTLQLGIRWDYQPPATEAANRMASWNPNKIDPISNLPGAYEFAGNCPACSGKTHFGRKDWNDFGPRIGLAWQPLRRWTLRASYGIMYEGDVFNGAGSSPSGLGGAWVGTYDLGADPVEPWRGIFNWDEGFPTNRYRPPSFDVSYGNINAASMTDELYGRSPMIQQWNFNVQRELAPNFIIDVGYLGRLGTGLREGRLSRLNQLDAAVLAKYGTNLTRPVRNEAEAAAYGIRYPYPGYNGTVAGALRPYPQLRGITTVNAYGTPLGFSTHHAIQIIANRQFKRGLTLYGNYTWSKSMANIESSDPSENTGRPLDYYSLKLEKAISDFDVPHAVKAYIDWDLPFGKGKRWWGNAGRIANAFAGGWSVSAIVNYYSGTPLGFGGSFPLNNGWNGAINRANVAAGELRAEGFDPANFQLSNLSSPNNTYLNKAMFSDPAPLTLGTSAFRMSQVRGRGTINEDLGLQKNSRIGEKVRLQIRAEFLNLFNRHVVGGINTSITSPLFGQATSVSGNRQVQVGMRADF